MASVVLENSSPRPSRDLLSVNSPLGRHVWVNPARMHGEPCFRGTRVPVQTLFDHLRAGDPLEAFLSGFPDVARDAAVAVIDLAATGMLEGLRRL